MDKTTRIEVIENNKVKHFNFRDEREFFSVNIVHGVKSFLFRTKETRELEKNLIKSQIKIKYFNATNKIGEAEVYFYNVEGKKKMIYYMNKCFFTTEKDLGIKL